MILDPYQTTFLKNHDGQRISVALETGAINGAIVPAEPLHEGVTEGALWEVPPGNDTVEPILAPKRFALRGKPRMAIDTRASKRIGRDGVQTVASPSDYRFQLLEGRMAAIWVLDDPMTFLQTGVVPIRAFAHWVANGLVRKLGLDPGVQLRLHILLAYYYMGLHSKNPEMNEMRQVGMANLLSRALGVPPQAILQVIEGLPLLSTLPELIAAMIEHGGSERLSIVNLGVLYTILGSAWFGANGRSVVAVCLEYPPTFLAMIYSAFNDRSYHGSFFTKQVVLEDRQGHGKDLTRAINDILSGASDV